MNEMLVDGKIVWLEYDRERFDRYRRTLGYIYVATDSTELFVNDFFVRNGFARVLTVSPNVKYRVLFERSEQFAQVNEFGIWGVK